MAQTTTDDLARYSVDIIDLLLAAHREPSDRAAKPLAAALREWSLIIAEAGGPGIDYIGIVDWDNVRYLVEDNNAWTRVYDLSDAEYDVQAAIDAANE